MLSGDWLVGFPHGYGTCKYTTGMVYIGQWEYGKQVGVGRCEYPTGHSYEGQWENGLATGNGHLEDADFTYDGEVRYGVPHGSGTSVSKRNAFMYTGQWQSGLMTGQGKYVMWESGGELEYIGQMKDNHMHGEGELIANGELLHKGMWACDEPIAYEGELSESVPNGTGIGVLIKRHVTYSGSWKDGLPCGEGEGKYDATVEQEDPFIPREWDANRPGVHIFTYRSGQGLLCESGHVLKPVLGLGRWWCDADCNKATCTRLSHRQIQLRCDRCSVNCCGPCCVRIAMRSPLNYLPAYIPEMLATGSIHLFTGAWEDGEPNGHGLCLFADGGRYEGMWCNGYPHGEGEFCPPLTRGPGVQYPQQRGDVEFSMVLKHHKGNWEYGIPVLSFPSVPLNVPVTENETAATAESSAQSTEIDSVQAMPAKCLATNRPEISQEAAVTDNRPAAPTADDSNPHSLDWLIFVSTIAVGFVAYVVYRNQS
jgi:hypothetical protein